MTSATHPLPGDRRRAARAGRAAAPPARCCRARPSCRREFGASRVTVRRALEVLRDEGLSRRARVSAGSSPPSRCASASSTSARSRSSSRPAGAHAERRVTEFAFVAPPERVARVLGVDQVLRVKRLNLADGEPFAVVTVWCPAELGRQLSRRGRRAAPVLRAARRPAARGDADDRRRRRRAGRRRAARRARRRPAAALPAGHDRHDRPPGADERARLPRPPHRVRRRAPARRAVADPRRPPPRRVTRLRPSHSREAGRMAEDPLATVRSEARALGELAALHPRSRLLRTGYPTR